MLTSTSGTIEERISVYFYRISFLKLQILNDTLSNTSTTKEPGSAIHDNSQNHREGLQAWYEEWNREVELLSMSEGYNQEVSRHQLKAWGQLQYNETLLFLSRTNTSHHYSPTDSQQVCDNFVQACKTLASYRAGSSRIEGTNDGHTQSSITIFFPRTWTTAHAVFAAGLRLFQNKRSDLNVDGTLGRNAVLRRCLTLMASLEADPNNMAAGFTEILERLCSDEER
ncbi:hypothetical protein B0J14DRAFT_58407 [Halenospora varia]|nr:hypothetical protein B0J14DRAFT_58407 [Halenospora varia]